MIYCIKFDRNEYAKKIRKSYENGLIKERRCHMKQATLRDDGIANALTTVLQDNLLLEVIDEPTRISYLCRIQRKPI